MNYNRSWLQKLDYKYGRKAIRNLMSIIVFGMALVFLADLVMSVQAGSTLSAMLVFDRDAIFAGQIWRLISFVFIPPNSSILFIILSLYFYWLMGSAMEDEWGSFKFDVFYLCGVLGSVLAGLITGYATNNYLNMSLFLAFALLFPEFKINLFFVLPIKVKYLAYLDAAYLFVLLLISSWQGKVALLVALLNIAIFFWRDFVDGTKRIVRKIKWKRNSRKAGWR